MDAICRRRDGSRFVLDPARFLGKGSDPKGKADYQGCGEFNPVIVFSDEENRAFQKPENKTARDNANSPNRRILIYLFAPGTEINPAKWPCPTTAEDGKKCKARFWSDAEERRKFGEERRQFEKDRNTFACRFYHGMAMRSPCETLRGCNRISVRLIDHLGFPATPGTASVVVADALLRSNVDDDGLLAARVPEGDYSIQLPSGQYVLFGDAYELYKHDPVPEIAGDTSHPFPTPPNSKNDRFEEDLEDLWNAVDDAFRA